jgi:transcriptional regulator with GAF, ATPase, and Fis domain/polyferredoxin
MARLVVAPGSPGARAYTLSADVTTIGRNADNAVVLDDPAASRFHANVSQRGSGYVLRDLNSSAGTYLTGRGKVEEAELQHGDRVRVGDTELLFELEAGASPAAVAPPRLPTAPVTILSMHAAGPGLDEGAIAFKVPVPDGAGTGLLSGRRAEMLTKVAEALQWVKSLDGVLATLLDVVFELFQPDRGVILLKDRDSTDLVARVSRPVNQDLVISQTIVQYALGHRMSVMVRQTAGDERFMNARSVVSQSIRAAVCCPLISRGRDLGALYVDAQVSPLRFSEENLALFNLVAANAAIAIDNAILLEEARGGARLSGEGPGPVIANSAAMKAVEARIDAMRRGRGPILIAGEPGTGKLAAAMWVHRRCQDPDAAFLAVDCADFAPGEAQAVIFGVEASSEDGKRRTGWGRPDGRGALDVARSGTLVLQHVDALDVAFQEALLARAASTDETLPSGGQVQLVATAVGNPGELAAAGRLLPALAQLPDSHVIQMPPLRARREDVVPLANYLLAKAARKAGAPPKRLNGSAEAALRKLQFRHGNVAELKEAVELAAVVADGPELGAEHLFTGPKVDERRGEYELADSPLRRALVGRASNRAISLGVLAIFAGIAAATLFWREGVVGRVANGLVWGVWWPALIVVFLLVGRVWCPFCPIALTGRFTNRGWSLGRKPAAWMKQYTGAAMTLLFLAIIWSERVFHMQRTPAATGVFLVVLAAFPAVLSVFYEREVWCRYLCPLGALSAGFAVPSPLVVHANQTVCASQCTTHECSKGSAGEAGCPVFLHPLYVRDAHFCKLCFSCLRSCRHQSAKLYVRLPLLDIWRRAELSPTLIPFATITFFVTLVMLASQKDAWGTRTAAGFTVAMLVAVCAGAALAALLPKLLCRNEDRTPASRAAFGLLVVAWGPLMAFHLQNVPGLDALSVRAAAGSALAALLPALNLPLLGALQVAAIGLAMLLALVSFPRIWRHVDQSVGHRAAWRWGVVGALAAAHLGVAAALVIY